MATRANIRQLPLRVEGFLLPLSVAVLMAGAALYYRDSNLIQRARLEVEGLNQAAQTDEAFLSSLKDIETGQRGYLLTGDSKYLRPYQSAKKELPTLASALSTQLRTPDQAERLSQLQPLVREKIAEIDAAIGVRDQVGPAAALAIVRSDRGQQSMDAIRQLNAEMRDATEARLLIHAREVDSSRTECESSIS